MKKHKFWLFFNSLLAFISAFIFMKAVILLTRFSIIRILGGSTKLLNFELECINPPYGEFWNPFSVFSIYLSSFIVSAIMIILAYIFYKRFRMQAGLIKLWFVWLYIIAISQSFGVFLRDIPFYRDIYHALNWMFIPYGGMLVIAFIMLPVIFFTNFMNIIRFSKMAPHYDYIATPLNMRKFYGRIAFLPAVIGSATLLLLNVKNIQGFEIIEKLIILFCVGVAYLHFLRKSKKLHFRRVKNDTTDELSLIIIILFVLAIIGFGVIKYIFY